MLHLAQVKAASPDAGICLTLLAQENSPGEWITQPEEDISLPWQEQFQALNVGMLVVGQRQGDCSFSEVEDATPWILKCLTQSVSLQEMAKIEQWRQELTLKSQELSMKVLELESRRKLFADEQAQLEQERQQWAKERHNSEY